MNKEPDTQELPEAKPKKASAPVPWDVDDIADEKSGALKRKLTIGIALLAAVGGGVFVSRKFSNSGPAPQKQQEMNIVSIKLPPPPPPPPKPTPPPEITPQKQEMVKQDEVTEPEEKPVEKPQPAPQISTSVVGKGGDPSLGTGGTGGTGFGQQRKNVSRFGWYAGPVQTCIAEALRKNKATKSAKLEGFRVRIRVDSNGRISSVELKDSSGQPAQDEAIRQTLLGLQLKEPPPADMPMPINLRLNARAGLTAQR